LVIISQQNAEPRGKSPCYPLNRRFVGLRIFIIANIIIVFFVVVVVVVVVVIIIIIIIIIIIVVIIIIIIVVVVVRYELGLDRPYWYFDLV
jgi:Flp pilus assembly protein TadB